MEQMNYKVQKEELLFSLRLLADGIFDGEVMEENGMLVVCFRNGQKFRICAEECKFDT